VSGCSLTPGGNMKARLEIPDMVIAQGDIAEIANIERLATELELAGGTASHFAHLDVLVCEFEGPADEVRALVGALMNFLRVGIRRRFDEG
jgi:hypothetical protein